MGSMLGVALHTPVIHMGRSVYEEIPSLAPFQPSFDFLQLTDREVRDLLKLFREVDKDESGNISIMEFLNFFEFDRTKFTIRAFSLFDEDKSGELNFREFVISIWNYCTINKKGLTEFAFQLYDMDSSGVIDEEEMVTIVKELYGANYKNNEMAVKIMTKIKNCDGLEDTRIIKEKFVNFSDRHPAMLFPAFKLQLDMRERILGKNWWEKVERKKKHLSNNGEKNIMRMLLALNEESFARLADDEEVVQFDDAPPPSKVEQRGMMKFMRRKERQEKRSSMPVLRGNGNGNGATTTQIKVVSADGWDKGDASASKKAKLPLTKSQTMKSTSGKKV